jgi:two-component system, sensor histidine kinase and response regulator
MKSAGKTNFIQEKSGVFNFTGLLTGGKEKFSRLFHPGPNGSLHNRMETISRKSQHILEEIKSLGFTRTMDGLERGKLSVFNQLNLFQFLTGIVVPLICVLVNKKFPVTAFFIASLPAWVNLVVLFLNFYFRYEAGMITYFILYPLVSSMIYMYGMNLGVELYFFLNGIMAVFFLPLISQMLFSVALSMVSYFVLVVINKEYSYQLHTSNFFLYLFNQGTAIVFIFYALFLIKKENNLYQLGILATNRELQEKNAKIETQKTEIEQKAAELSELNLLKNKLFSVISHDLKTPMYALRNLFRSMQQMNMSGKEIKAIIPDVVTDLNYTTGLMENLLHWVKNQMHSASITPGELDMAEITDEAIHVHQLQASTKKLTIQREQEGQFFVYADRDMVTLVIRNLLSNAIKFTPEKGTITIRLENESSTCRVSIIDNGVGMDPETLRKIQDNSYYSTQGTARERGTGLGLMLSRDFLSKNGGKLSVDSEPGKGSVFSFTLPLAENIKTA